MTIKSLMSLISPIPLIIIHGNEALVPRLAAAPRVALGACHHRHRAAAAAEVKRGALEATSEVLSS